MLSSYRSVSVPLLSRILNPERANDHSFALISIEAELDRLFNTKSRVSMEEYATLGSSVFGYGVPDFTHISQEDPVGRDRLLRAIETAIRFHEPRILNPVAEIVGRASESSLSVVVYGDIPLENKVVRLKFFAPDQAVK